jgi:hypothetical protein
MNHPKIALLALLGALASPAAFAQSYVSGAIGRGHINLDCAGTSQCKTSGSAYKLTAGHALGDGLAAEVGYVAFGKARASVTGVAVTAKARAVTFGVAYEAPVAEGLKLGGRVGLAAMRTSLSATNGVASVSEGKTKAALYYGLYANYALTQAVSLEFGMDFSRARFDGEKAGVRAITAGARVGF